ncbi:hypothetical protein J7399_03085 [Shimia sp. R9_1]|uniref:hypothetical protein n=1 Tax=Shimia sp. R9_1 TaxID=2821111 RepID=UPI001ADD132E|nr:hypothetical protein [Shimia sp. R9_1]MBO9406401.1 hypothetical protein [Shimia sp. R9_1]
MQLDIPPVASENAMIETAYNARTRQAFEAAHAERSKIFVGFFKSLFGTKKVPLSQMALTEPSRCA